MKKWDTTLFYKQCGAGGITNQVFGTLGDDYDEQYLNAKTYLNNQYGFQFFPSRDTFLAFLRKYAIDDADTFDRLFNIKYRADELFRNYNEQTEPVKTTRCKTGLAVETSDETRINKCGHLYAYAAYLGNNKCVFCDRNQILESL